MTFSILQALAEFFDNSGGGGISYGGTGQTGTITGDPTGGTGTGTSYPSEGGGPQPADVETSDSADGEDGVTDIHITYDPKTGQTVEIFTGEEMVLNLGPRPPIYVGEELILDLRDHSVPVVHGPDLIFHLNSGTVTVEGEAPDEGDTSDHPLTLEIEEIRIINGGPGGGRRQTSSA